MGLDDPETHQDANNYILDTKLSVNDESTGVAVGRPGG